MERELGCTGVYRENPANDEKTYLYITPHKKVGGCLIVESISEGFPLISEDKSISEDSSVRCSKVAKPATCGVSRIWVYREERRRGIASKMMEAVRSSFIYGFTIPKDQIAFTQPTPDGKKFFTKYIGSENFLVYT